ncbi:MAG: ABC transporter ATP-binding protein [Burkholderiales bacterium]|nr:ABC transporter ATP-binding protein [Burkholderiales bacterium]
MSGATSVRLRAQGLSARHGAVEVLSGIDLSFHGGQWLAVVGPNGAGKSTLLHCLAGLMAPSSGQVTLDGQAVTAWPAQVRARRLSWLAQNSHEDAPMSVQDTVALGRLPHQGWMGLGGVTDADRQAVDQALLDTDTSAFRFRRLDALSGGERQRVWLARALAVQASVLLLDEPGAHLDAPHQRLLARVLRREASQGRAVVSVVHELSLALAADRVAVLNQGALVAVGSRDDTQVHRALEQVFDHAIEIVRVHDRWVAVPQV